MPPTGFDRCGEVDLPGLDGELARRVGQPVDLLVQLRVETREVVQADHVHRLARPFARLQDLEGVVVADAVLADVRRAARLESLVGREVEAALDDVPEAEVVAADVHHERVDAVGDARRRIGEVGVGLGDLRRHPVGRCLVDRLGALVGPDRALVDARSAAGERPKREVDVRELGREQAHRPRRGRSRRAVTAARRGRSVARELTVGGVPVPVSGGVGQRAAALVDDAEHALVAQRAAVGAVVAVGRRSALARPVRVAEDHHLEVLRACRSDRCDEEHQHRRHRPSD